MGVLIAGISLIVHVYSVRYMAEEAGYARFFALLDLMTAALLVMVAAGDLVTLVVSWHVIGVLLYFLLAHDLRRQNAFRYAFWTFSPTAWEIWPWWPPRQSCSMPMGRGR